MPRMTQKWTFDEIEVALRMRRDGCPCSEIAVALGRGHGSVLSQMYHLTTEITGRDTRLAAVAEARPTAEMWADRNVRLMAPRSLTALVLGDPAPGYSALDKR